MSSYYSFADPKIQIQIQKWREQLKDIYLLDRKGIRFGRSSIDVAEIDDLCVELELVEEQGKTKEKHRKTIVRGIGLEYDKKVG